MLKRHTALLFVAGASLLVLAGCNDDGSTASQSPEPPAKVESQPSTPPQKDSTDDALRRITEGAASIRQGAEQLARDARQHTDKLIEDAGPAIERIGDIARDVGVAVNQVTERALRDFQTGITILQQRVDESRATAPQTGDPAALLAPPDQLRADTRIAAKARSAGVGPDYVGVWAADAAACALVDLNPQPPIAVVTPTTIRRADSVCNFAETPLTDKEATLKATCIADDEMEDIDIQLQMPEDNALELNGAAALIRCRLPD